MNYRRIHRWIRQMTAEGATPKASDHEVVRPRSGPKTKSSDAEGVRPRSGLFEIAISTSFCGRNSTKNSNLESWESHEFYFQRISVWRHHHVDEFAISNRTTSWSDAFGGNLLDSSMNSLQLVDHSLNFFDSWLNFGDNATFGCLIAKMRLTCSFEIEFVRLWGCRFAIYLSHVNLKTSNGSE